jgi:iron complex outermembrane recepter protein
MRKMYLHQSSSFVRNLLSLAVISCLAATAASAQQAATTTKDEGKTLDTITVTGSRSTNRSATETAVPVDIISREMIQATGATETGRLLQKLAPSFNFPQSFVSDGTDLIWPASLRGMGPDQVLVLVNGKRRHQQALVNVQQTIGRGSAGTDINAIPISAIKRIEVLRDGASAQYGSDAIAGVINIILNDASSGSSINSEFGQTSKGDGEVFRLGVNGGIPLGEEGFLNLTAEVLDRDETNRAGPDTLRVSPPRVTQRIGDADLVSQAIWFNSEIPFGSSELYAFGGISKRKANSSGFFRSAGDGRTIPALYPNGFLPTLLTTANDWSLALGFRGDINDTWKYDVSVNRGFSQFNFGTKNSANVSWYYEPRPGGGIYAETPTSADDGTLRSKQLTFNADVKGSIDWGVGTEPLYLAAGIEWRRDGYQIVAGDPVSYTYGRTNNGAIFIPNQNAGAAAPGIQGFPGFTPGTEVDESRRSVALYVDGESKITERFLLGAAARFEDYSDTGRNQTGKITGRFNFTDAFALRGALSTGVRAPGSQQALFSQVSTTLGAGGVLTDTVTVRQGSPLAAAFGIKPLKEETSRNATLGLAYRPDNGFSLTVDLYRIDIKDRIVLSGYVTPDGPAGCVDPLVCPARVLLASVNVGAANFFTNAIDTKTTGVDIVAQYAMEFDNGAKLIWDGSYSHNQTKVETIKSSSTLLAPNILFDNTQVNLIEKGLPRDRGSLGFTYSQNAWRVGLNNSYYGSVRGTGFPDSIGNPVVYTSKGKWLTDLSFNYKVNDNLNFTLGGNNIFDVYPDKWKNGSPYSDLGFTYGWETLPFSLNGASYYVKMGWDFK